MPQEQSLPRPSDKWIPYYFFAFFGVLVLILVPMCIIAVKTNSGVVTEEPYEKGLAYNKAIQAEAQQKALNWRGDLTIAPAADSKVKADFTLTDSSGTLLRDAVVSLWFVRPAQSGMDQKTTMIVDNNGHYQVTVVLPAHGLWEARVAATVQGQNYQMTKRIVVP